MMYSITGITGQVGGAVARTLLENGRSIRAIVRNPAKAQEWAAQGAEIAVADFNDAAALEAAFTGVAGAFIMAPPCFTPQPGFPETRTIIAALRTALAAAKPEKIVVLSSVGAQHASGLGLITQLHLLEQELGTLPLPSAFLRAGWFMENSQWDVASAKDKGEIAAFLGPLERPFPMVATQDIGRVAAETLQQQWTGRRIIEIEGPRRYSQNDTAEVFARLLGRPVEAVAVPRGQWQAIFEGQGAAPETVAPRLEMLDGFNSGWIDFAGRDAEHAVGTVPLEQVLSTYLT